MAELRQTNGGTRDTGVTSLMYTEDKGEILWVSHERAHELEQKALTVALTAADSQLKVIQDYIVKYIDSELRKLAADHLNTIEQIKKDWTHHNEVHAAHGIAHEREHKQTADGIDKAEKTALTLSNALSADLQRTILAQAGYNTKDQMATEFKAVDARVTLLERGTSLTVGRETGISASWAFAVAIIGILLGVGGLAIALAR